MTEGFSVPQRFRGPPQSANGGYICGRLAGFHGGNVEVTLVKPPPLERALRVERALEETALWDDAEIVAKARSTSLSGETPPPRSPESAEESARHYTGFANHIYPECFVCGPARAPGDGMRIFAGRVAPEAPVAAPWTPDLTLADSDGFVGPEFVWAALDCPGYFALGEAIVAVLGRMSGEVIGRVTAGQKYSVVGTKLGSEGRKYKAATALFDANGALVARSTQVWIRLR